MLFPAPKKETRVPSDPNGTPASEVYSYEIFEI